MKNNRLALAIPTYNRASILIEDLEVMMNEIRIFSIPVYISDDSNSEESQIILQYLRAIEYPYIYYYHNEPGLGHDRNCIRTLSLTTEDYTWYLGDSAIIKNGGISKVLMVIDSFDADFISVNVAGRKLDLPNNLFDNGNELLLELGWHLTQTGATIYSRRSLNALSDIDLSKCKNFPQTFLIFQTFVSKKSSLYWINEKLVFGNPHKQSYWNAKVFDIFLKDWHDCMMNLPNHYLLSNKIAAYKRHNLMTGLFNLVKMVGYRLKGIYDFSIFKKFCTMLRESSSVPVLILFVLSIMPTVILNSLFKAYKFFFELPKYK